MLIISYEVNFDVSPKNYSVISANLFIRFRNVITTAVPRCDEYQ